MAFVFLALAPTLEAAAIREEVFTIEPGWNLIHIDGEPLVKDLAQSLSGLSWKSIWTWIPATPAQGGGPGGGRWAMKHRNAPAFLSTLGGLVGSTSYALEAESAGTLRVKTLVRARRESLRGGVFQLFGPSVSASAPPTLESYFSRPGVKEHVLGVFEHAGGAYRSVGDKSALRAGAAYWVFANQELLTPDPVRIQSGLGGLKFDSQVTLAELELDVAASSATRQMAISAVPSADGQSSADWVRIESAQGAGGTRGGGGSITVEVPPNETRVRLAVRAEQPGIVPAGSPDQGAVIEVDLPNGRVTVSAELTPPVRQGIWIGEAVLDEVDLASVHGGGFAPAPILPISLLLEIQGAGPTRLLPCIQVQAQRAGKNGTYRLEAALFNAPVALGGTLASDGSSGVLSSTIRFAPGDPLNPYRHRYHPELSQGYDVSRAIELRFDAQEPPENLGNPLATVGAIGGVYSEEVTGLAPEPIHVRGRFRLRQLAEGSAAPCAGAAQ